MSTPEARSQPTSGHQRPARIHPCLLCQQRKVKCDRKSPCSNCQKARVDCVAVIPTNPRPRKRRFPEAELLARLRRYERLLEEHGVDVDKVNSEIDKQVSEGLLGRRQSPIKKHVTKMDDLNTPKSLSCSGQSDELTNFETQQTEAILQGSSEDEAIESPITSSYDKWFPPDGLDLFFGQSQGNSSLKDIHPNPAHIFRLWQTFLDNVNPLVKILHAPSMQQQVLEASENISTVPQGLEALMFAIYHFAVVSLSEKDCQIMFGTERSILVVRYQHGVRQALANCSCLRNSDILVLQALTLYLTSALQTVDPRSLFCLTGITVRMGQRIGLDQDGAGHGISPFDVEMRRRLWWHIAILDHRVGEQSGATSVLSQSQCWTTKFPLNVNDSDLYPGMREPPLEYTGATEMLFTLLKCELGQFYRRPSNTPATRATINEYGSRLQEKYLQYCDPKIPLHLISILMGRSGVCQLHLVSQHPRVYPNRSARLAQTDKDALFLGSIEMLEYHNKMLSSKETQRYLWYINRNFPFPAQMHLLYELQTTTIDPLADRAWQQITKSIDAREAHHGLRQESPLHIALAKVTMKAWDAREVALRQRYAQVAPPETIVRLREFTQGTSKLYKTASACINTGMNPSGKKTVEMERHLAAIYQMFGPDTVDPHADPDSFVETHPEVGINLTMEANPMELGHTIGELNIPDRFEDMDFSSIDWGFWDPMVSGCDFSFAGETQDDGDYI